MKNENAGSPDIASKSSQEASEPRKKRFVKPSLEEVRSFIREKGYHVDPEAWYAHYESNGWMVGRHKMADWRASVIYWNRIEKKGKEGKNTDGTQHGIAYSELQPKWDTSDLVISYGNESFG